MARNNGILDTRAERLRDLASGAENLVILAGVVDETLAKARLDLLALSGAARQLATRLEREADAAEVAL
jgi:hypothetical protein